MRGAGDAPADYATDATRGGLAWSVERDPRFSERIAREVELAVDRSTGGIIYRAG